MRRRKKPQAEPNEKSRGDLLTLLAKWATIVAAAVALLAYLTGLLSSGSSGRAQAVWAPKIQTIALTAGTGPGETSDAEVILHNAGTGRAIIKRVIVRILHSAQLPLCFSQGGLGLSENYNVQLPERPSPGEIVEVPLHEQLTGDEADRFELSFATKLTNAMDGPHVYLYQLELSALHDLSPTPVKLGTVIVSLPLAPSQEEFYWSPELGESSRREQSLQTWGPGFYATFMPCWRSNSVALKRFLGLTGTRSQELTEIASHVAVPSNELMRSELAACERTVGSQTTPAGSATPECKPSRQSATIN